MFSLFYIFVNFPSSVAAIPGSSYVVVFVGRLGVCDKLGNG